MGCVEVVLDPPAREVMAGELVLVEVLIAHGPISGIKQRQRHGLVTGDRGRVFLVQMKAESARTAHNVTVEQFDADLHWVRLEANCHEDLAHG